MVYFSTKKITTLLKTTFAFSLTLLFPGCSFFNSATKTNNQAENASIENKMSAQNQARPAAQSTGSDEVYATIGNNHETFITKKDFDVKLAQMLQAYRGQISAETLPVEAKRKFLDDLIKMRTISVVWAENRDISSDAGFQALLNERMDAAKEAAVVEFFVNELRDGITISDADVAADYKKNKERYVKVAGGAQLQAISFDSEADAKAFLDKVGGNADSFADLAKEESKEKYKNFGFVSSVPQDPQMGMMQASAPEFLKKAALHAKSYPALSIANNGQKYWAFCATDKKESEYFDLNDIKDQLKEMLKEAKFKTILDDRIKDLVEKSKIKVNESHFKRAAAPSQTDTHDSEPEANGMVAA
jgi:hypothetical protein